MGVRLAAPGLGVIEACFRRSGRSDIRRRCRARLPLMPAQYRTGLPTLFRKTSAVQHDRGSFRSPLALLAGIVQPKQQAGAEPFRGCPLLNKKGPVPLAPGPGLKSPPTGPQRAGGACRDAPSASGRMRASGKTADTKPRHRSLRRRSQRPT